MNDSPLVSNTYIFRVRAVACGGKLCASNAHTVECAGPPPGSPIQRIRRTSTAEPEIELPQSYIPLLPGVLRNMEARIHRSHWRTMCVLAADLQHTISRW